MALLDLKEKKEWADFAAKESISVDSNGCIDAKETQVKRTLLRSHVRPAPAAADIFVQQARLAKQAAIEASER